ncbi:MAG: DUF1571 domain-containing protein [Nitrospirota bacterium]
MGKITKPAINFVSACIFWAAPIMALSSPAPAVPAGPDNTAVKFDPFEVLSSMPEAYSKVDDYTAIFHKRERVDGELLPEENILLKFKKPFKVYMKWLKGPHEGREALYVQGMYKDKVIGHEGGFFGFVTMHMDPHGRLAMRGNRHPVTDAGIGRAIEIITSDLKKGEAANEQRLKAIGEEMLYGRKAWHILMKLPPDGGYYAPEYDIWVDEELNLPVKIVIYGPGGELLESYGYSDLRLNPGLSDAEFDPGYKGYSF